MNALIRPDGTALSISESRFRRWQADYPGVDIKAEIAKANVWLQKNPAKAWKTLRGFEGWLERAPVSRAQTVSRSESKHYALVAEKNYFSNDDGRRASEDLISKTISQWRDMLGEVVLEEMPREKPQIFCQHEFRESFYGGGEWCVKCGMFVAQWWCLDIDHSDKCKCWRVV